MVSKHDFIMNRRRSDDALFYKFLFMSYSVHAAIMLALVTVGN